jgi:uncharacterized Ntn-hydrolase superfamily protein
MDLGRLAMTFSIIARDQATGRMGAAIASKFLAVGARNVFVKTGVGAIVSQAIFNPYYGQRGLALLAAGASAADAVRLLTAADEGRDLRQLHVLDRSGQFAAHTGSQCTQWCGHLGRPAFSVAGNTLAGSEVLQAMAAAYEAKAELPFARRLIAAMQAGEAAGGDTRGRQSAALVVHDREDYSLLDLRADDHPDPLAEIARLEEIARQSWVHFRRVLPSTGNPSGVVDRAEIDATIAASIAEGYE